MKKQLLSLAVALGWLPMAMAQLPPQAGDSLRILEDRQLTLPPSSEPALQAPTDVPVVAPQSNILIPVRAFRIEGNHSLPTEALLAQLQDLTGKTLTLAELYDAAQRLTVYYREQGYLVSRAYLPAQEIDDDRIVTIAIAEGRYGQITLSNQSRLRDVVPRSMVGQLANGEAVTLKPLERQVLLLDDLPGTRASSSLAAGREPGRSDLTVTLKDEPRLSGNVTMDNYGNRHTGEYRMGTQLDVASPLGLGDAVSLYLLGTDEKQLYYMARYDLPISPWGTRFGLSASKMDYELGGDFDDLDATGTADTFALFVTHPWLRSRNLNVRSLVQVERKDLTDELFDGFIVTDKTSENVTLGLSGDWRDTVGGGGVNAFNVSWVQGHLRGDSIDRGSFGKLQFSMLRLQHLANQLSLYTALQGQWTDGNLDSSEHLSLGGPYTIRGYPAGEASADEGLLGTLELRYQWRPEWQFKTFVDGGYARLVRHPVVDGDYHRNLSSIGVGAEWQPHPQLSLSLTSSWRTGEQPVSDKERTPQAWGRMQWSF
ncbi:ShlB/FhaC/HecB family hemolysin secretion/activation protein [Halopseudomonas maritima]|uniref:ShlB/FhaC/HecB family hemolysin secretion/activation protein n=1 Tax=Halopseudomonas maritima TaxID=2918528 RepID=UPI001EEC80E0|nr:ShlB/FhaC/HecB family hemolysin secretion/activation protein [Halopseudomonas maritima]UJJ30660.1 ShlB/FhaC/HecB family hemolysin secretion/activation protein [Halopseudomonas maritima]